MKLKGWAGYPLRESKVVFPNSLDEIKTNLKYKNVIARGNGRSYGDTAIGYLTTISMKNFNKIKSFDKHTGELVAESGILLKDLIDIYLPKGWFPFVTPGSKFVTLGGMVAANVHGKNQHKEGCLINYINWIEIINQNGTLLKCSRSLNPDLFNWTVGGMGLTGIILNISLNLRKIQTSYIKQKILITKNLDQTLNLIEKNLHYTYSVSWIDTGNINNQFGRGIIYLGEHATKEDLKSKKLKNFLRSKNKFKFNLPICFPNWFINKFTISIFNLIIYWLGFLKKNIIIVDYENFFYPLDNIGNWANIYGRKGFMQYQCVIPLKNSKECISEILSLISKKKVSSFVSTLKRFSKEFGNISFPMEGYSMTFDLQINDKNLSVSNEIDEIVLKYKGRFYLCKDSRMSSKTLVNSDSRFFNFKQYRIKLKLNETFNSAQSNRLKI